MLIFCLKHADVFKKYADVFLKICWYFAAYWI